MATDRIVDVQAFHMFWGEAVRKENRIRARWMREHGSRLRKPTLWGVRSEDIGVGMQQMLRRQPPKASHSANYAAVAPLIKDDYPGRVSLLPEKMCYVCYSCPCCCYPMCNRIPCPSNNDPKDCSRPCCTGVRVANQQYELGLKHLPHKASMMGKGISHDGEGRAQYLRYRLRQDPEDKYKFPISQNWDYGWKFRETGNSGAAPGHGHCRVCHQTFRPRNC